MIHISLFSGIGGFELAAVAVGWINAASCEINDFGHKILQYHFPNSYHHRDVKTLTYKILNEELTKRFGANWRSNGVILTGGFPCQGFSVAGKRLGTDDDRYLWPEYLRLIDEINPDWVCGENVTGILSMEDKSGIYRDVFAKVENRKITRLYPVDYYEAIYTRQAKMLVNSICESLEERGYEVQTFAIPACSVEAPHRRERIWFVANRGRNGLHGAKNGQSNNKGNDGNQTGETATFEPTGCSDQAGGKSWNVTNTGCLAGDRGQSSQGGGVHNRQAPQWNESANEFERSYKEGIAPHPISNDAGRYGHGQTGPAPRIGKVVKKERERLRTEFERIGGETIITDTPETISEHPGKTRSRRSRVTGSNTTDVLTIPTSIGIKKGIIKRQPELLNKDGKAQTINSNPGITRRQKLNPPGFAAKPGFGSGLCDRGIGGRRFANFPTQSPVRGHYDGISSRLVRNINPEIYASIRKTCGVENLLKMRKSIWKKEIWEPIGRLFPILKQEILLEILQLCTTGTGEQKPISPFSERASEAILRKLQRYGSFRCASQGSELEKQFTRQFADTMPFMSYEAALGASEITKAVIKFGMWHRNESIEGFGNAVVPQVVVEIFKAINEYERG